MTRPDDGALIRATTREWREPANQWWHTEEKFEILKDGKVIHTELHRRSPEGRWYSQAQARELFAAVGFAGIRLLHGFTREAARPDDRLFCVLGVKS